MRELLCSNVETIGIVFVRELSTVAVLSHILSIHPLTKDRFCIGTMVGTSNYSSKKRDLGALVRASNAQGLEDFRNGKINLLIGTSVLEEGIDVPACNMVICFDEAPNLKAFIQRRGRARMRESKLILLLNDEKPPDMIDDWMVLEEEMKKRYEDKMRQLLELEDSEMSDVEPLYIPKTGAKLDFDQAKSHLEHFCRKLSIRQYADLRPYYIFKETETPGKGPPQISATVVLPMSLPPDLRRVESSGVWSTEKNASKDAAFQAYVAIYKAGLLNDNLLPLKDVFLQEAQSRVGVAEVCERWSPWTQVAHAWDQQLHLYQRRLRLVDRQGGILCEFDASLPLHFPGMEGFELFWDASTSWTVETGEMKVVPACDLQSDQSLALVGLAWQHRLVKVNDDARFILHIRSPAQGIVSQQKFVDEACLRETGLIRNGQGYPYFLKAWLPSLHTPLRATHMLVDEPVDVPWLVLEKWPRRRDFLHPVNGDTRKRTRCNWPAHLCRMDSTHISNVYFGAFIPAIVHMIEIYLVANELCNTLLKDVGFSNIPLVITAISSPHADEATNYQRLEFLGDSILKTSTAATVTANCRSNPPSSHLEPMINRISC